MANLSIRAITRRATTAVCVCAALAARPAAAHTTSGTVEVPRHLIVDGQYYDASPAGFRAYLETIRSTNPQLFAELAPDADRFESRVTMGRIFLIGGFAAGMALVAYGFFGRSECTLPPINDPNFAADSSAWDACNHDNMTKSVTFSLIGLGASLAGMAAWVAVTPSRDDLFELVNRNNRANPHPMQLQLGYDPSQHLANAGAVFTF